MTGASQVSSGVLIANTGCEPPDVSELKAARSDKSGIMYAINIIKYDHKCQLEASACFDLDFKEDEVLA